MQSHRVGISSGIVVLHAQTHLESPWQRPSTSWAALPHPLPESLPHTGAGSQPRLVGKVEVQARGAGRHFDKEED